MMQLFNLKKSKDSALHIKGHEKWVYHVKSYADGECILSAGWDKIIRMFSIHTGKCIRKFEGHQGSVWRAIVVDKDTLLTASDDNTARLWKISDGSSLKILHFDEHVWSAEMLDDNRFAVGTIGGNLHIYERDANEIFAHVRGFVAHKLGINEFSVCRNRFSTASLDRTAKIWDASTFECLGVLTGHGDSVRTIAMSDSYIATGSFDGTIRVHDARTYDLIHIITTHGQYIRNVHLVGPEENLLSSADDGTTRLFRTLNGQQLWERQFGEHAISTAILRDGRLATGLSSGEIVVYGTPPNVASHMKPLEVRSLTCSTDNGRLHDALLSCISGYSSPVDHCESLIKYEACRVSFEEWCSAHRILVLAVEDGDIVRDTKYNGEQSWWYEQLYLAIRHIELQNQDEHRSVKRCLNEAKQCGLIESIDAVLAALHVTNDLKETAKTLHRAGILVIERILRMEDRLERLGEAYIRYKNSQRKSQLVGIALQVIPIAGGAMAGAFSAGTEIVKGLSVKDVADYALGFGSSIAECQVEDVSDRILKEAAETLSPASLDNMDLARRERLEHALRFCGLDTDILQELFLERVEDNDSAIVSEKKMKCEEVFESWSEKGEDSYRIVKLMDAEQICELDETSGTLFHSEDSGKEEPKETGSTDNPTEESAQKVIGNNVAEGDIECPTQRISGLKHVKPTSREIAQLSQEEIADVWAGYICRFDDREHEKLVGVRECLLTTLKGNEVYGAELVDRRLITLDEILSIALQDLRNGQVVVTLGLRARLKRFLLDVSQ